MSRELIPKPWPSTIKLAIKAAEQALRNCVPETEDWYDASNRLAMIRKVEKS